MNYRTDLALERRELETDAEGVENDEITVGRAKISRIRVTNEKGAAALDKPIGSYVTVEVPPLSDDASLDDDMLASVKNEIARMLPSQGLVLVAGLGNTEITPDALGPKTASKVIATRHITGEIARAAGLTDLRPVCVLAPGVLGQTGIETGEIIKGIVEKVEPAAVIVVDALASRRLARLGCTVQISDAGISPGAGVGNKRKEISRETLGVPVVAVGVPTVVDAATLAYDLTGKESDNEVEPRGAKMIVTPREIDLLIDRAAQLVSHAINCALQPGVSPDDLLALAG